MLKGEVKDREKGMLFLVFLILSLLSIDIVAASADVAYIYKKDYKVDKNVLDVFSELGLSYELIDERYLPNDFSSYKMIFVGDERFKQVNKIPINKKSSVIANYYFGEEFGLTDSDGISKLAATSPLNVKKDNKIIQVYTQAKYNSISIPYYYLDDENKASGMQTVARTYTGDKKDYDFGDVISYSYPGTKLTNGKYTQGKICFYGIIESDYWTPAARELFKDCVGFVATTCLKDSDCGETKEGEKYCQDNKVYKDVTSYECQNPGRVNSECIEDVESELVEICDDTCIDGECVEVACYNDFDCDDSDEYTEDACINPGSVNSYCEHYPLECLRDNDCGEDGYIGEKYCEGNAVYQDYQDFECQDNECLSSTGARLIEQCSDICREGECVERECVKDSDCAADYYSEPYCQNNDSYRDFHDFSCQNEICAEQITNQLSDDCGKEEICLNGGCRGIMCRKHADCGENSFIGIMFCKNENVYEDFISFECHNAGTIDSYCTNYTKPILREYCEGECISGECITCFANLDCGTNSFVGEKYCEGNAVYQDYQTFICENPGTSQSDCLATIAPQLIEECADLCIKGECRRIECYDDGDCDDFSSYTIDECNNPGKVDSYCSNTEINCINNNDCGLTGFAGKEYCYENDVFKDYQNSTCVNSGTKESYCNVEKGPEFLKDCGEDECSTWHFYCKGNEIWENRSCYNRGCEQGACFSEFTAENMLVEECEYGCVNGECVGECKTDGDCDNGLFCNGQEICLESECVAGNEVDCSAFDIEEIATCDNIPDANPLTLDYRKGFVSVCDEEIDTCTTSISELTYNCDTNCGAECVTEEDCPEKCTQTSHKLYTTAECNNCLCEYSDYQCVVGKCGAECDEDSDCSCQDDYCDGTTLVNYPEYSSCGTSGSQGCLCQTCEPILIENSPQCGYVEPHCGDGNLDNEEECDDGNNADGDGCSSDCKLEIECYDDEDCLDDYYEDNYCKNNDTYRNLVDYSCVANECVFETTSEKIENCGESYCEDWEYYCKCGNVWRKRTCYEKGCMSGECYSEFYYEEKLYEECEDYCTDGECGEQDCDWCDWGCGRGYCNWSWDCDWCDFDWNLDGFDWCKFNGNCGEC